MAVPAFQGGYMVPFVPRAQRSEGGREGFAEGGHGYMIVRGVRGVGCVQA